MPKHTDPIVLADGTKIYTSEMFVQGAQLMQDVLITWPKDQSTNHRWHYADLLRAPHFRTNVIGGSAMMLLTAEAQDVTTFLATMPSLV